MLGQMLKSWNFSLSVFFLAFLTLTLLIILIKPLTTKAHDRRASGDCGISGSCYQQISLNLAQFPFRRILCFSLLLCRLRSIATHRDHFGVVHLSHFSAFIRMLPLGCLYVWLNQLCKNCLLYRYDLARSIIDAIFGPKAHKDFPRSTRIKGGGCGGSGFYPGSLKHDDYDEYADEGVDLQTEKDDYVSVKKGLSKFISEIGCNDDSFIWTHLFPVEISGLMSFPDYWIAN